MGARQSTRGGWPLVLCYAAVAGASQLLWLTYAPVTTAAAEHYGVSVTAIGWLANVFPLLYVVLAVPAGLALDRRPRPALGWGVVLTALGGVVRLGGDSFGWALAGQLWWPWPSRSCSTRSPAWWRCCRSGPGRPASRSGPAGCSSGWWWPSARAQRWGATTWWR